MKWNVATARDKWDDLLKKSREEPQLIYDDEELVAAVIAAASYHDLSKWSREAKGSLGRDLASIREMFREESYELEIPPRKNRQSSFEIS